MAEMDMLARTLTLDPQVLRRDRCLSAFGPADLEELSRYLECLRVDPEEVLLEENDRDRAVYFVLEGGARLSRNGIELGLLGPGEHTGEFTLVNPRQHHVSLTATKPLAVARLRREDFGALADQNPRLALRLLESLLGGVVERSVDGEGLNALLRERSLPRRTTIQVRTNGGVRTIRTGTLVGELLPQEVNGHSVVGGLVGRKAASLTSPLSSDCDLEPLTTATLEGQSIDRNSQALLLLEASQRLDQPVDLRLSHSVGFGQRVVVHGVAEDQFAALAAQLDATMQSLVEADLPLLEEWWTVEEAQDHFLRAGWDSAAALLATWRDPAVPLCSYGQVYALSMGPLLPTTSRIRGFHVLVDRGGLLLMHGCRAAPRSFVPGPYAQRSGSQDVLRLAAEALAVSQQTSSLATEQERWLEALGITSVGAFNAACIEGKVSHLIHVSEGFQEKGIGRIADMVQQRGGSARIVCIAGPSSAGKTTFIKRLMVQLEVNGITPVPVSLDDYYVDRELTPRDPSGDYDFEALEALNLDLLAEHLERLLAGEVVKTAKYDFKAGKSLPTSGPQIALREHDILMLEGIHGLNPRLLAPSLHRRIFRAFACPFAQLPFDRLTRVHASDVRLLRRIVRDRHTRGHNAVNSILRWPSVRAGERKNIFPFQHHADVVFDSSLIYELAVIKVYAERYLLEVPQSDPAYSTAFRLLQLLDRFVTIYPDQVPRTSILREFIGESGFEY
jgi:uridine kinase